MVTIKKWVSMAIVTMLVLMLATPATTGQVAANSVADSNQVVASIDEQTAHVMTLIDALPAIEGLQETNQLQVQQARAAYEQLSDAQKAAVTNVQSLVEKENALQATAASTLQAAGTVYFSMEDFAHRTEQSEVKEPFGTIVERQEVPYYGGDTIADVTVRALAQNNITPVYTGDVADGFYLSAIENFSHNGVQIASFGERSTSDFSGWMITLNDWLINQGASAFTVSDGDTIAWHYSTDMGGDIGADWSDASPAITDITLIEGGGQIAPAINEHDKAYTLTVPKTTTSIQLKAISNKHNQIQYFVDGTQYKFLHDIPVSNGTEITIVSTNVNEQTSDEVTLTVAMPNTAITVPKEATLTVGKKTKHFIAFEQFAPVLTTNNDNATTTYHYNLANKQTFNYRVSQPGKLTNTGTFIAGNNVEITAAQLNAVAPNAILNKGTHLEGNLYLNINTQNHLSLQAGESFNLLPLRSWQALIEGIQNYFFEPDFHYDIITGKDVVQIEPGVPGSYAKVNVLKDGTAIVKVTYDALKVNGSQYVTGANDAFSAIWSENVGLFVVTVGQPAPSIKTGIESNKSRNENNSTNLQKGAFDADIDSVYFKQGERGAYYTFTPEENSTVSVLRPTLNKEQGTASYGDGTFSTNDVEQHEDGSYTILLTEGRNIVKVEKDGVVAYQVMTARPLQITVTNVSNPNAAISAGDKVTVTFDGLSFPANKLSGIYNYKAQLAFTNSNSEKIAGTAMQYNITTKANTLTFTIPTNHEGQYVLQDGHIIVSGFGSQIGAHRGIDPLVGASPNFNAGSMNSAFSIFPDITIIAEPADTAALQQAIVAAEETKVVTVSTAGKDVEPSDFWVTQQQLDTFTAAIAEAQQLVANKAATQQEIDAKTLALQQQTTAFNDAKKSGLKGVVTVTADEAYNSASSYLVSKNLNPGFGSEWVVLALARGGYAVPENYFDTYYNNVEQHVKSVNGELHSVKYTEYSRLILALTAIGKDPRNVGGYDLVAKLGDYDKVIWQGINGSIFGLIALDTWGFELDENATTTREKLIEHILSLQLQDGGFTLFGTTADPDITGMAVQALAPYAAETDVKTAIDKALVALTTMQKANGGYGTSAESVAQVITALTALAIDPLQDDRFKNTITNLLTFYHEPDGGFKHVASEQQANGMATEQAAYTLAAYKRLTNNQVALYDMADTKPAVTTPTEPTEQGTTGDNNTTPPVTGETEQPAPTQPDSTNNGNTEQPAAPQPYGQATISIVSSATDIPLAATTTAITENESVFDVLKRVTTEKGITLNSRTTSYGVYVEGINGLSEFDKGPESGWMYRVNGVFPSYSAALHTVKPGDKIEWLYTVNLGKDIGGYVDESITEKPTTPEQGTTSGSSPGAVSPTTPAPVVPNPTDDNKPETKPNKPEQETSPKPTEKPTDENNESTTTAPPATGAITQEQIAQYMEEGVNQMTIAGEHDTMLSIPTVALASLTLQQGEKVNALVKLQPDAQQFAVQLAIEKTDGSTTAFTTQKDYVTVTVPVQDASTKTVVLQVVDGEYRAVPHKIVDGEAVILTKASGTFVVVDEQVTFKDIDKTFSKEEIEFLASRHVIKGVNEDEFRPNQAITRAHFAVMISRALGLQATKPSAFKDTKGRWYEQEVQALYEAGITTGKTADSFDPEAAITRQQAAAFMARILHYVQYEAGNVQVSAFKDAHIINEQFKQNIDLLNSLNIMTGKEDGSFNPRGSLTRAQMAKILKRTLHAASLM